MTDHDTPTEADRRWLDLRLDPHLGLRDVEREERIDRKLERLLKAMASRPRPVASGSPR